MTIRFAEENDIPKLIEYWKEFAPDRFRRLPLDESRLVATVKRLIGNKDTHCFFVGFDADHRLYGVLAGKLDHYYFSSQPGAQLLLYWVSPERRSGPAALKLMMAFKQWAQNRNLGELLVSVTSGEEIDRTDQFLKKLGFKAIGANYAMPLANGIPASNENSGLKS